MCSTPRSPVCVLATSADRDARSRGFVDPSRSTDRAGPVRFAANPSPTADRLAPLRPDEHGVRHLHVRFHRSAQGCRGPHAAIVNQLAVDAARVRADQRGRACCRRPRSRSTCRCGSCFWPLHVGCHGWWSPTPGRSPRPASTWLGLDATSTVSRSPHFVPSMLTVFVADPCRGASCAVAAARVRDRRGVAAARPSRGSGRCQRCRTAQPVRARPRRRSTSRTGTPRPTDHRHGADRRARCGTRRSTCSIRACIRFRSGWPVSCIWRASSWRAGTWAAPDLTVGSVRGESVRCVGAADVPHR